MTWTALVLRKGYLSTELNQKFIENIQFNECFTHERITDEEIVTNYDPAYPKKKKSRLYLKKIKMQMLNDDQCHKVTGLLSQNPTSDFPKEITCSLQNEKPECPAWLGLYSFEVKKHYSKVAFTN